MATNRVWFITGASRGFGKIWATAALERGDQVIATARDPAAVNDLKARFGDAILPIRLDVVKRQEAFEAVSRGMDRFGSIDVLINNAGYGLVGTVEEVSEVDVRDQFETNVYGAIWATQAVLPIMRQQGSGHIISVSSVVGFMGAPSLSMYGASKWALEGMMESLYREVEAFGIKVTLLEPVIYATDFAKSTSLRVSKLMSEYDEVRAAFQAIGTADGLYDPLTTAPELLKLVDSSNPPLRHLVGPTALKWALLSGSQKLERWVSSVFFAR